MKKTLTTLAAAALSLSLSAQSWPTPTTEAKPGVRWWWLGSAVDKENLQWNLRQYADHGIGAVEITPIYGVQGNDENNISYLSDRWMDMLRFTGEQAARNGIELDMATGTGWPFGGPWVPLEESACRAVFVERQFSGPKVTDLDLAAPEKEAKNAVLHKVMLYTDGQQPLDVTSLVRDGRLTWTATPTASSVADSHKVVALYIKYGVMRVKRAAPGGEGLVIDHFDKQAVQHYLSHIEAAFERSHTPYPHTFFNDSYEVADATWTPTLFDEFERRRGYRLQDHLPELIASVGDASHAQVLSDYRETLGDLLLENFTQQWTAWAHSHGAVTRNQAHGSPANLIDCYAAVDIPEIEGFGLSNLGIKGLRTDTGKTRKNDSDYSMFKYAPSAAHVCGKPYTSSETFTWLTEHFRTSLSQLKPDLDLMFCAGVNHMFFHGTCYSPRDDEWPGWKFYASIDMSPTNSIWRDAPFFMQYVERCQSFLQLGRPDNDFLVLLPVRDAWQKPTGRLLMQFSIHAMGKLMPDFRQAILDIDRAGFDCDYISERLLLNTVCRDGRLVTEGGTAYKGLVIPGSGRMPDAVKAHIEELRAQGASIIYGIDADAMKRVARPEAIKTQLGLKAIRRSNASGHHYFMANLSAADVCQRVPLAVDAADALWFNPLNGEVSRADLTADGLQVALRSGESLILQTFDRPLQSSATLPSRPSTLVDASTAATTIAIDGPWTLTFTDEAPRVEQTFRLDTLGGWQALSRQTSVTMGTGVYTTTFRIAKNVGSIDDFLIDLGDVRESARVFINGHFIGCAWAVPFVLPTQGTLRHGDNELRIEVTNLPANRISELDRQGVKWRKMEEINVVDINYKKTLYDQWEPMPSGLCSGVKLIK